MTDGLVIQHRTHEPLTLKRPEIVGGHKPEQNARRVKGQLRVLIASPDLMTGELLASTSKNAANNFKVRALVGTSDSILQQLGAYCPDVAVISEELQDGPQEGFKLLRKLQQSRQNTSSIMLLKNSSADSVIKALRTGARGIFYRSHSLKALPKCIRTVYEGQIWVSNQDVEHIVSGLSHVKSYQFSGPDGSPLLTSREEDVVRLLVDGMTNREIAAKLQVSVHSIRNYLYRIFEKVGVSTRVELILYAFSREKSA